MRTTLIVFSLFFVLFGIVNADDSRWVDQSVTIQGLGSSARCDYAWIRTENYLKALGAKNIRVRCLGGLPYSDKVQIMADFKVATLEGEANPNWQWVDLDAQYACELNRRILMSLLRRFEVRDLQLLSLCEKNRLQISVEVLK